MSKCYIAGPMRSKPGFNYPAFFAAEEALLAAGWEQVWNPARMDEGEAPLNLSLEEQRAEATPAKTRQYADRDLDIVQNLLRAENGDAVVVLPDWEDSTGATAEVGVARWVGLSVLTLEEAIALGQNSGVGGYRTMRARQEAERPEGLYEQAIPRLEPLKFADPPDISLTWGDLAREPHYFHPTEVDYLKCAKCGGGPHALMPGAPAIPPGVIAATKRVLEDMGIADADICFMPLGASPEEVVPLTPVASRGLEIGAPDGNPVPDKIVYDHRHTHPGMLAETANRSNDVMPDPELVTRRLSAKAQAEEALHLKPKMAAEGWERATHPPGHWTDPVRVPTREQKLVLDCFMQLLLSVTKDGGNKRAKGEKPGWFVDESHWPAVASHVNKIMHDEVVDKDSGARPEVHMAWRLLAIAYQEILGGLDPEVGVGELARRGEN